MQLGKFTKQKESHLWRFCHTEGVQSNVGSE